MMIDGLIMTPCMSLMTFCGHPYTVWYERYYSLCNMLANFYSLTVFTLNIRGTDRPEQTV